MVFEAVSGNCFQTVNLSKSESSLLFEWLCRSEPKNVDMKQTQKFRFGAVGSPSAHSLCVLYWQWHLPENPHMNRNMMGSILDCRSFQTAETIWDHDKAIANSPVVIFKELVVTSAKPHFFLCSHMIFFCDHNCLLSWSKTTAECGWSLSMLLHIVLLLVYWERSVIVFQLKGVKNS